jgi:hypothetical protein
MEIGWFEIPNEGLIDGLIKSGKEHWYMSTGTSLKGAHSTTFPNSSQPFVLNVYAQHRPVSHEVGCLMALWVFIFIVFWLSIHSNIDKIRLDGVLALGKRASVLRSGRSVCG